MIDKRIENAVKFMESVANDNSHGYDQQYRWGEYGDYDCSSLTITAFQNAGLPLKDYGATYTGNMSNALKKVGFKNIISKVNITTGDGLIRGDILLNTYYHVAVYLGNGYLVQSSINEKGTATGGKAGDQTGYEINISRYKNYRRGWNEVWRFPQIKEERLNKKGDEEMVKIIQIESDGKVPTVSAINKDGHYYVKLRDLDTLGLLKVSYDAKNKRPIIEKA